MSNTLWFDCEADGLLDDVTTIHCIVTIDENDAVTSYIGPGVKEGAIALSQADRIVAHHALGYDIPLIKKLCGVDLLKGPEIFDTLVMARLCWPDIRERDFARLNRDANFPKRLIGAHSLEAWGQRMGELKGDKPSFDIFTQEMLDYCIQDVRLLKKLAERIIATSPSPAACKMEHKFAWLMIQQEKHGFLFDRKAAEILHVELLGKKHELEELARAAFPPKIVQLKTKQKVIPFNPGSRNQIAEGFKIKYGWKPTAFTPDGRARIDEAVLRGMEYPEADILLEFLLTQKRIAQLATGPNSWMKGQKEDGRIHGRVNPIGCVTSRCSHSRPNMAQVPHVGSPYGTECRSLFTVPPGYRLVGVDASGLELRCLGHYLHSYDDGKFIKELLEGDIHMANARAAGLDKLPNGRDLSKTMIYCFLYGGGPEKLGEIVGGGRKEGTELRERFLSKTPALRLLREGVLRKAKSRGHLVALDRRLLPVRHAYASLNTLLQSAGAILVKQGTCILFDKLTEAGLVFGADYSNVAHIHDELQLEVKKDLADFVGEQAVLAIKKAGTAYGLKCPMDAEFKVGSNWSETH